MTDTPLVSVVLPARNEAAAIGQLLQDIATALAQLPHEIVVVDDGSTDGTGQAVLSCVANLPGLRLLQHAASCGQSAALRSGILAARGRVIATLDADGQNPAADLPRMLAPLLGPDAAPDLGLVQGQRRRRQDRWARRVGSRIANGIRNLLLHDGVRDSGCGMKAFPRDVYLTLPFFDHIHRFMPAIVQREGFRVLVVEVDHAERNAGQSNYNNLQRALVGIVDLLGAAWLIRRRRLPLAREVLPGAATPLPPR
jgi:dolichol-phosphate mannosyltransferase